MLHKSWIPVEDFSGQQKEVGILDLFKDADSLRGIVDPAPTIEYGLYRFLFAFLMDALEIAETRDAERVIKQGLDLAKITDYAKAWESRFDLFDIKHPFLQTPPVPGKNEDKINAISRLLQQLPSGTGEIFFDHQLEDQHAFSPAVCARALCTIAPFMTAGGAGYAPSINGAPGWYVLVKGSNLAETLAFNLVGLPIPTNSGSEPPPWRSDRVVVEKQEVSQFSTLEGLTWQPRRVLLVPPETETPGECTYSGVRVDYLIREVKFAPGFKARGEFHDPYVPYRTGKKGRRPIRPREGREVWRDTGPLMLLEDRDFQGRNERVSFDRPLVVTQFKMLQERRTIPKTRVLKIVVYGIRTDLKMKIFEWHRVELSLPAGLLEKPGLAFKIYKAMETAEDVAYCLRGAIATAYPGEGGKGSDAFANLMNTGERRYWRVLEPRFRGEFLEDLTQLDFSKPNSYQPLRKKWIRTLRAEGERALNFILEPLDADARSLKNQVSGRDRFHGCVTKKTRLASSPSSGRKNDNEQKEGKKATRAKKAKSGTPK